MNACPFELCGAQLAVLPSGAVWWAERRLLCVSDLHLGKSERVARRGGTMLPPYETADTLARLETDIAGLDPACVICLGDSFDDDMAGSALEAAAAARLDRLQSERGWIWITGNHDPGVAGRGGEVCEERVIGPLTFRHAALPGAAGEVSGHYHPKARLSARGASLSRRCLLHDRRRAILPAYGTYTGGLDWSAPVLQELMEAEACAVLLGTPPRQVPLPRTGARGRSGSGRRAPAVLR